MTFHNRGLRSSSSCVGRCCQLLCDRFMRRFYVYSQSIDKECLQRRNWKVDVLVFILEMIVRKEFAKD